MELLDLIAKWSLYPRRRPRIAFCIGSLRAGGSERHLVRLLKGLPEAGFDVSLVVSSKSGLLLEQVRRLGVEPVHVPMRGNIQARANFVLQTSRLLRRGRFDIVQAFGDITIFYVGLAAQIARTPLLIFGLRNTRFMHYARPLKNGFVGWTARNLVQGLIVNSMATRDLVAREYRVPVNRIQVIYNGVAPYPDGQPDSAVELRKFLKIPSSTPIVGIAANLVPKKQVEVLVRAAAHLSDLLVRFVVVGDGEERPALERIVAETGLSDRFCFVGIQAEPLRWIQAFDIGVLCSKTEGLPQAILEYMATGRPVVATAVGGTPELVVEGETGYMVSPGDPLAFASALRRLIDNAALRERMGKAGQNRARERFSLEQEIEAHVRVYKTWLNQSR